MENKCVRCGNPIDRISGAFCTECLREHNKETRELKQKYKKKGLCANCGKTADSPHILCKECREIHKKSNRIYRNGFDPLDLQSDLKELRRKLKNENNR